MSQRKVWVDFDRLLVHLQRKIQALSPRVAAAPQEVVVGGGVARGLLRDFLLLLRSQIDSEGLCDASGDFVLYFENVRHLGQTAVPTWCGRSRFPPIVP